MQGILGPGRFGRMKPRAPSSKFGVFFHDGMGEGKSGLVKSVGLLWYAGCKFDSGTQEHRSVETGSSAHSISRTITSR